MKKFLILVAIISLLLTGVCSASTLSPNIFDKSEIYNSTEYPGLIECLIYGIQGGETYRTTPLSAYRNIVFYDSNNIEVGFISYASNWNGTFTTPENADRMKMYFGTNDDFDSMMICQNELPELYYPFGYISEFIHSGTSVKSEGMSLLIFGDSITETATVSDDGAAYIEGTRINWPTYAKTQLQIGEMWNYAKTGTHYQDIDGVLVMQKLSNQISSAIANNRPADIIVVSCGVNDVYRANTSLGSYETAMSKPISELDRTMIYEAIRWAFYTLRERYPNAMLFAATPIQCPIYEDSTDMQNVVEAITKMAKRYNFIVIDAYNESGIVSDFEVVNEVGRDLYDGLHTNSFGQRKMANLYTRVILNSLNY
jgi:lysophospholipase L1-like esterase